MRKFYSLITMLLIVTIASSQTYTWNNAAGGDFTLATNWTPNRGATTTGDILIFNIGSSYTVNNIPTQTVSRINVSAGTVTFAGQALATTLQINNIAGNTELIVANGASLIQTSSLETIVLGNGSTADISGTYSVNTGATYNANGTSTNAVTTVSATGIIDNGGTVTSTNAARLVMQSGSQYLHAQNGGNIPTAGWNANATLEFTGVTTTMATNVSQTFGNVTWNCPLQSAGVSFAGNLVDVNGDLTVQNTNGQILFLKISGTGTDVCSVAGDLNLTGGNLTICGTSNGETLQVAGDVNLTSGTLARGNGTSTFIFNGTTTQNYTKTGGTLNGAIIWQVPNNAILNLGTSVIDGTGATFTLASGGKIITANANGINSAGATGSIQVTGARSFSSVGEYEFRGAATGVFTTTPTAATAEIFTVNNTGGNVTLNQPMTINATLVMTAGVLLSTNTNLLTIDDGAGVTGASNASFISGPMRKLGNDAITYPVGRVGVGYVPLSVNAAGGNSTLMQIEYLRGTPPNASNIIAPAAPSVKHISGCDYWSFVNVSGTVPTYNVTLNWNANNPCNGVNYVTQPSTIKAVSYNGTGWNLVSAANGAGSATTGTVVFAGANAANFQAFALGTTATGNQNPLPVLFDNVRAFERSGGIQVEWSNLTERDLLEYVVERSTNGRDYTDYISLTPKSNLNEKADYSQFDATPNKGANFYRIRALEQSGKLIYSKVLRVDMGATKKGFSIYPNPVIGRALTLTLTGVNQGAFNVRVVTATGQDVFHKTIQTQASGITQTLQLPSSIKPGVYTLAVNGEGFSQNQMFIVQ